MKRRILSCNAFYSFADNTINMIIGMMGEPFYSSDMSIEELYASIGAFWVGHEISHAFDNNGAQFDAEGAYRDWWTAEDKEEFNKRVQQFEEFYETYDVKEGDAMYLAPEDRLVIW